MRMSRQPQFSDILFAVCPESLRFFRSAFDLIDSGSFPEQWLVIEPIDLIAVTWLGVRDSKRQKLKVESS